MSCLVQTDQVLSLQHLPHVDQILGQSNGLRVARDGDGPVQVGGGVPVLAVGDPDHGSAYLPRITFSSNNWPTLLTKSVKYDVDITGGQSDSLTGFT